MAPVEQYDWEEVANELQAENDRLETALAQTRMRADKKLKQLNVLRDELAEFDAGERERAGGDEWFLAWALPPTVEAALAPHSKAPVAAKKTPVPPPAAAEGAARSYRAQAMKSKWLGAGTKVQDRVKSARTSRPTPKAPPSTPPARAAAPKSARTSIPQRVAVLIEQLSGVERAVELAEEERREARVPRGARRRAGERERRGLRRRAHRAGSAAGARRRRQRPLAADESSERRGDESARRRQGAARARARAPPPEARRAEAWSKDAKWVAQMQRPSCARPSQTAPPTLSGRRPAPTSALGGEE